MKHSDFDLRRHSYEPCRLLPQLPLRTSLHRETSSRAQAKQLHVPVIEVEYGKLTRHFVRFSAKAFLNLTHAVLSDMS
jgi:hypothetical protein